MTNRPQLTALLGLLIATVSWSASAVEFVPIREYQNVEDSPFPNFGIEGALIIEDFEDPEDQAHGLTIISSNQTFVREGFSVAEDAGEGKVGMAFEAFPAACATTFPMQCPSTVTLEFNEDAFSQLPTYVGFVWTDAVRASEEDIHPWLRVNLTNANDELAENLINELPIATSLKTNGEDDTLISFIDEAGIRRVDITVMTNGSGTGGHLAIDHIQYGVATLAGDTNLDGDVDFQDFLVFAKEFGNEESGWGEGDFTFDGKTTFPDLLKLSGNYGKKLGRVESRLASSVPEPQSHHLLLLAILSLSAVRRRKLS